MLVCYVLFAIGSVAMIIALRWINKRESGSHIIFTPLLLFCLNEAVFVWPATVFARVDGVSEDNYATLVVLSSTFAFLAGYVLVRELNGWSASSPLWFWSQPLRRPNENAHAGAILLCAGVFIVVGFYLYQGLPPAVTGLRQFLRSGYSFGANEMLAQERLELTKAHYFGGAYRGQGMIRWLMRVGWPYLATVSLVLYLRRRETAWRIASLGSLVGCFVYIAGDGTRGPFLWALVSILVAVSYQARLRVRTLAWFGSILLTALVLLSLTQKLSSIAARGGHWSEGVQQLADRIFIGNGINSVYVIEYVRVGYMDLRWGGIHRTDIGSAVPFISSGMPFTYELFLLQNPDAKATRTTFSSMTYLGRLYGDFGWGGCVVGFLLLGGFTAWASQTLFRQPKTVTNVAFVGMLAMGLGQLNLHGSIYFLMSFVVLVFVAKLYAFCLSLTSGRRVPSSSGPPIPRPNARPATSLRRVARNATPLP